ncbi:MAG: hypothetical protein AAF357_03375 [Verrucomicrobiota bacterium]
MTQSGTGNRKLDTLKDRASSKIIWGEDEESVYQFLRKEGVAPEIADQFIDEAMKERAALIRKRSLIKFIAGAIGALVCGGIILYFEVISEVRFQGRGYWKLFAALLLGLAVCGAFALKHLWALLSGRSLGSALED